jgi:hypothetical protein
MINVPYTAKSHKPLLRVCQTRIKVREDGLEREGIAPLVIGQVHRPLMSTE